MPITWNIEDAVLRLAVQSSYDFQDWTLAIESAFADPGFRRGMLVLIDDRMSNDNPSAAEARARVAWLAALRPEIGDHVALLTTERPLQYGMARMASVYFEIAGMDAVVFTDTESAIGWLAASAASVSVPFGEEHQRLWREA